LEKNLELMTDTDAKTVFFKPGDEKKLIVNYDKFRLSATVMSESLKIPAQTMSMSLRIGAGVKAQAGGNATAQDQIKAVSVPGLYSLDIVEMKQLIVTGDDGEPENVLQISTGMAVNEKEMARSVQAWLLPVSHESEDGETQAWNDPAEVTEQVLKSSTPVPLLALPTERENSETHGFKFVAEPGRTLFVRIKKGLRSAGGYQLGAQRDELFRIKRSAPELSIMSKGSLLALSGEKKLPLLVRDLPGVKVEIGRLLPQQLQHLVTQSGGDMTKPEFYYGITPDSLTERYEKKIPLNLKSGKTHYESVNFADYLRADNSDRRGVFILTVQGFDPSDKNTEGGEVLDRPRYSEYEGEGEEYEGEAENPDADIDKVDPTTMRDRRLVIVTDMGIITKQALDGSRDVFVQSIHDGSAVSGATVEVWGRNGAVLLSQVTDAGGRTNLPSLAGFVREKQAVVLVVKKAGDLSFLPLNRQDRNLDLSRFDVGGLRSSGLPNQMSAYVFSDRGIYRPGDTMNIGVVAKSSGWAQKLTDLPVEAEVIDARGLVVRRQKMKLGAGGLAEFTHTTQESSPTGNYTIHLNLARESANATPGQVEMPALRLGSVTVKVQEFMPDRMKVAVNLSKQSGGAEGWISPKELNAKVNVQNLFGTPAPQRRVEASLTLSPTYPAFTSFPDYQFFDPSRAKEKFQSDLATNVSDAQGSADLVLGLERYARATYQLHLLVIAFEPEGGRSVAAETMALVSDVPFLIGHKADGDLEFISRNSSRSVNFIAIDSKAKRTAASKLKLVRLERRVVSVLVKQPNGLYRYESKPTETVLNDAPFEIGSAGKSVLLATQTPGNFVYQIRDAEETVLARVDYSVAGTA
ncbi:MAG: alpha-2-macroglobulin family protein, partial [Burkholderiales bacterium]|nr:alpha-2-macroglobulin family protein [Burkholderiales bacterium]